jgi:Dolichyl-phosphate-mannose-protein mannosyltransferase
MSFSKSTLGNPYLLLSLVWWVLAIFVNPLGEFALNDDWAYAKNVYYLAEEGRFKFSTWPAMTLMTQMLWGALWSKIFGFSFSVLRLSVLVLGWATVLLTYKLLERWTDNRRSALFGAFLLAFNPMFFCLSYSFMTEVPFLCCTLLALHAYLSYTKTHENKYFIWAVAAIVAATLIRQTALVIPVAFAGAALLAGGTEGRKKWWQPVGGVLVAVAILQGYTQWLKASGHIWPNYGTIKTLIALLPADFWERAAMRSALILFYLGIFLLPLNLYRLPGIWQGFGKHWTRWVALALSAAAVYGVTTVWGALLYGNIWYNWGLGPKLLRDTHLLEINKGLTLSKDGWRTLCWLGALGGGLLVLSLLEAVRRMLQQPGAARTIKVFSLFILGGYSTYLLMDQAFFDRYLLFLMPFLLLLLLPTKAERRTNWAFGLALVPFLLLTFLSIAGTHDYLAWNRLRWQGLNTLVQQGVPLTEIDGGFEFNAWHEPGPGNADMGGFGKSWWNVVDDKYVAALGPMECRPKVLSYGYNRWINFDRDSVFILGSVAHNGQTKRIYCDLDQVNAPGTEFLSDQPGVLIGNAQTRQQVEGHSGAYSALTDGDHQFLFTTKLDSAQACDRYYLTVWCRGNPGSVSLVMCASEGDTYPFYKRYIPWDEPGADPAIWRHIKCEMALPSDYANKTVAFYVWNHNGETVWFDDLEIIRSR